MSAVKDMISNCEFKGTAAIISEPNLLEFYKALNFSDETMDVLFRENIRGHNVASFADFIAVVKSGKIKARGHVLVIK